MNLQKFRLAEFFYKHENYIEVLISLITLKIINEIFDDFDEINCMNKSKGLLKLKLFS